MEDNVASRLKLFMDTNGIAPTQFADMCGIARPTLSQILSGRNKKISDIIVGQIHHTFPDLSILWLLFGEGPVKVRNVESLGSSGNEKGGPNTKTNVPEGVAPNSIGEWSPSSSSGRQLQKIPAEKSDLFRYNRPVTHETPENSNVNALKPGESLSKESANQVFESDLKILDLTRQIERMKQNPRKVVQITIYYDDSTFETFVPK